MYFRLDVKPSLGVGRVSIDDEFRFYNAEFLRGVVQDVNEVPVPWRFEALPNPGPEINLNDYYPEFELMSRRMVDALQKAGVDNLQLFPAEITVKPEGLVRRDYVVVNVVGLVSGANDAASPGLPIADLKYYPSLVLQAGVTPDLKMFRLAESWLDVIVHESVASALREAKLVNVALEALDSK